MTNLIKRLVGQDGENVLYFILPDSLWEEYASGAHLSSFRDFPIKAKSFRGKPVIKESEVKLIGFNPVGKT